MVFKETAGVQGKAQLELPDVPKPPQLIEFLAILFSYFNRIDE